MNVPSTTQIKSGVGASRKLALAGIVLFLVGFILGGVGNQVSGALPVIPFADTLTALGFVLALFAASRWKRSPRNSGSGDCLRDWHVLRWRAPSTHIGSGLGFGLEHLTHIFIGLTLMMTATTLSVVLTFYHTKQSKS